MRDVRGPTISYQQVGDNTLASILVLGCELRAVRTNMIISVSQQEAGFEISVMSHKSNEQFLCWAFPWFVEEDWRIFNKVDWSIDYRDDWSEWIVIYKCLMFVNHQHHWQHLIPLSASDHNPIIFVRCLLQTKIQLLCTGVFPAVSGVHRYTALFILFLPIRPGVMVVWWSCELEWIKQICFLLRPALSVLAFLHCDNLHGNTGWARSIIIAMK